MAFINAAVYGIAGHKRSMMCCNAMFNGIRATGDRPRHFVEDDYREPLHDVAVFYGYTVKLRKIMDDYVAAGRKVVFIDLGYWGREGMRGYHKIVVNARHPTAYFQSRRHDAIRRKTFNIELKPWRQSGSHILLAGMGEKAAEAEGKQAEAWEREALKWMARYTDRTIIYRPKPSWKRSREIPGTKFSWGGPPRPGYRTEQLHEVLANCHAVVTHHSNVAVDAIVAGVPALCWKGVALSMSSQDFRNIEAPLMPEGREDWLNAIAWCQWNIDEMTRGQPWRHLKNEGLI